MIAVLACPLGQAVRGHPRLHEDVAEPVDATDLKSVS